MLSKKVILSVICLVVLFIIVIIFFVPKVFSMMGLVDPSLLVMVKSIECRLLEKDICFLRYPEAGKADAKITGVIMTPIAYNNYDAYLVASRPPPAVPPIFTVTSCKVSHEQCRFEFTVAQACDGSDFCSVYVFIDSRNPNGKWDSGEPISKELDLTKIP